MPLPALYGGGRNMGLTQVGFVELGKRAQCNTRIWGHFLQ